MIKLLVNEVYLPGCYSCSDRLDITSSSVLIVCSENTCPWAFYYSLCLRFLNFFFLFLLAFWFRIKIVLLGKLLWENGWTQIWLKGHPFGIMFWRWWVIWMNWRSWELRLMGKPMLILCSNLCQAFYTNFAWITIWISIRIQWWNWLRNFSLLKISISQ